MIERMTDRAREALAAAHAAAGECGHGAVQAPHLVLGILANPQTKGGQALHHAGLRYAGVLDVVGEMYERGPDGCAVESFGHEAGMLLRGAAREARARDEQLVGTAHLALACTRDNGVTSIGPIVAGRERVIRATALGLLERAARLEAQLAAREGGVHARLDAASLEELLLEPPELLKTAKVMELLLALPQLGRVRVGSILAQCAIPPGRTLGSLTLRQREELRRAI